MIVRTCLCLITRADGGQPEVLLALKKTGFGAGKWVGLGGHLEDGETAATAAAREVMEESGLLVSAAALEQVAAITFRFPARPGWDQATTVFTTAQFSGEPAESDEVAPRWFAQDALPFAGMWDDARYWLLQVLAGQPVDVTITFADDCATVKDIDPPL